MNKKLIAIIVIILAILCCCCTLCIGIYSLGVSSFITESSRQQELNKPVIVDPTTNEPINEDSPAQDFQLGDTIRINNAYTVRVTKHEEKTINNKIGDYSDPFNGNYVSYFVELQNISDSEIITPSVVLYDDQTGVTDTIGTTYDFDLTNYHPYESLAANKKYAGYLQFKVTDEKSKPNLYIRVTDTNFQSLFAEERSFELPAF